MSEVKVLPKRAIVIEVVIVVRGHALPAHEDPRVLMVQLDGQQTFMFPGCVLEDNESLQAAAARALRKDTSISLPEHLFELRSVKEVLAPGASYLSMVYRVEFREHVAALNDAATGPGVENLRFIPANEIASQPDRFVLGAVETLKQAAFGFRRFHS